MPMYIPYIICVHTPEYNYIGNSGFLWGNRYHAGHKN